METNKTILIVDDMEINRVTLSVAFKDDYRILEAEDGKEAIQILEEEPNIVAVLLDIMMPGVDGMEVLRAMNKSGRIKSVPVFLITAESSNKTLLEGYELGAVDVVRKPIMSQFLKCRVNSVIELYRHRNELESIVAEQVQRLNSLNQNMIEALATLVEFRDVESGEHVKRICNLTRIILTKVCEMYPEYTLPPAEIEKIAQASILHDVGKIAIPDSILTKPGRLTDEEFAIMKQHSEKGCEILQKIPNVMEETTYKYSYDICRHHHERWDGRGYPDGLKENDISIWAQVVSVADVYDALTSQRVYKPPFDQETAIKMICNGECGAFNPKVLSAFLAVKDQIAVGKNKEKEVLPVEAE